MRFNPPRGRLHQHFRIIIFIRKKGIKRYANPIALLRYFLFTNLNCFRSQTVAHDVTVFSEYNMFGFRLALGLKSVCARLQRKNEVHQ